MKIDITKIEGYKDDMTADEKLALISKYEVPDADYSGYVKKETFDKTASEVAEWKRKHNALLSEEERKEAERAAKEAEKDALLESLKKEKAISEHKAKFLGLGYDENLATETAIALAEGNMVKVFENQSKFNEAKEKALRAEFLKGTPEPPAGSGKTLTKEEFKKMTYKEQAELFQTNPAKFKQITEE